MAAVAPCSLQSAIRPVSSPALPRPRFRQLGGGPPPQQQQQQAGRRGCRWRPVQAAEDATAAAMAAALKAMDQAEKGASGEGKITVEELAAAADQLLLEVGNLVSTQVTSKHQEDPAATIEAAARAIGDDITIEEARVVSSRPSARDASAILHCDESGCTVVGRGGVAVTTADELKETTDGVYQCDIVHGCHLSTQPQPENSFQMLEGSHWRIGYETAPAKEKAYVAMVGGANWNIALSPQEFTQFVQLMQQLRKNIKQLDEGGLASQEDIVLEAASKQGDVRMKCSVPRDRLAALRKLWSKAPLLRGKPDVHAFEVQFALLTPGQRQVEGFWPADAVMEFLQRVDNFDVVMEAEEKAKATAVPFSQAKESIQDVIASSVI
eukprot:jgi/Chlat1/9107/Chrsp97S08420